MKPSPEAHGIDIHSATLVSEEHRSIEQLKTTLGSDRCIEGDHETTTVHYELQASLKKLLLADLEYALDHKAEQELWNTCFKNQISLMQANAKDKKNGAKQKEWQTTLQIFLDSALGFYTVLLNQLCQTYDIDLPFRRKDAVLFGTFGDENRPPAGAPSRSSCCYVVQDCLVHMGDVARYRGKVKQAESFYRHAVKLVPSSGQPYNQLALLEAHHGDRISPVYYYVRSIAVRNPFPAATTNLSKLYSRLASQGPQLEGKPRLSASEYTTLFLQLHARLQQRAEPRGLRHVQAALAANLPRLLLAETLSPWRLLQMLVITVQSAHAAAGRPDGGGPLEPGQLSESEQRAVSAALEPAATALDALLRCSYRLVEPERRRNWPLLPVVRLYVAWLAESPQVLTTEPFITRPQLWAHLCHLVNGVEVTAEMLAEAADNSLPLPEDLDLAGFLPLAGVLRGLKLARPPVPAAAQPPARAARLRAACQRLARHGVVWSAGPAQPLQSGYQAEPRQVLAQLEEAETDGLDAGRPSPVSSEASLGSCPTPELPTPAAGEPPTVSRPQPRPEAKAGILKSEAVSGGRRRQNVALQAIMKSGQRGAPTGDEARLKEGRQVTFRTPSPSAPTPPPPPAAPAARAGPPEPRPPRLADTWRQPGPLPPPAAAWPPPRARHPLEDAPPQFNPSVPPPGWSGPQPWPSAAAEPARPRPPPFDPLKPLWAGWAAAPAPQPNPLAAMLSQCRGVASEPTGRRPDDLGVYSLFPSAPAAELSARGPSYSLFPSSNVQHQSLWPSAGPSPLERLIEQQKQQGGHGKP